MKYVLWGCGEYASLIWEEIKDEVVLVIDNNSKRWGESWNGHIIQSPDYLKNAELRYDVIIIASVEWRIIRSEIIKKYNIEEKRIDNIFFKKKQNFLNELECVEIEDEKRRYIEYIRVNPLGVFNDSFCEQYDDCSDVKIKYDIKKKLYYVIHANKKMYFSKKYSSKERCAGYYKSLLMEQDVRSPHRYRTENFDVKYGDVVLDAGVAEGNFALEIIDVVKKMYLVEADDEWVKALKHTFEPYKDKVQIVKGFLGDGKNGTITIDEIVGKTKLDFIKMDIEGGEKEALEGAKKILMRDAPNVVICTYHNEDDYDLITYFLKELNYNMETSEGYMCFLNKENFKRIQVPVLVKGVVRGYKDGR